MYKSILGLLIFYSTSFVNAQYDQIETASITFEFVSKNVKGTIGGFKSTSTLNFEQPENMALVGSVAIETLDTNNFLRNWSLKSGKYFDKKAYPRIYFESTVIRQNGNVFEVDGLLTIKGIERPITITFRRDGKTLKGTASIYTADFGINIKRLREDNLVDVAFLFVLGN